MPNSVDLNTVDLAILLSDRSVQQLLDIADKHPDWPNKQLFAHHPKNEHGEQLLTYEQVLTILKRLRLHTVILRRLHQSAVDKWEMTEKPITRSIARQFVRIRGKLGLVHLLLASIENLRSRLLSCQR